MRACRYTAHEYLIARVALETNSEETNLWNDIGNELAREKTARLLRNRFTEDERGGAAGAKRDAGADVDPPPPPLPPAKKPRAGEEAVADGGPRAGSPGGQQGPGVPAAAGAQIPEPYVRMMHEMNRCIGALTETARHLGARVESLERKVEGLAADGAARQGGGGNIPAAGAGPPAAPDDDSSDERRAWDELAAAVKRESCPTRKFVEWVSGDGGARYGAWRTVSRTKAPPQEGSFRRAMDNFCRKVERLAGEEVPPRPGEGGDLEAWREELARIGERAMLNAQTVFGARPTYSWLREWSGNMNQHQHVNEGVFGADKTSVNM